MAHLAPFLRAFPGAVIHVGTGTAKLWGGMHSTTLAAWGIHPSRIVFGPVLARRLAILDKPASGRPHPLAAGRRRAGRTRAGLIFTARPSPSSSGHGRRCPAQTPPRRPRRIQRAPPAVPLKSPSAPPRRPCPIAPRKDSTSTACRRPSHRCHCVTLGLARTAPGQRCGCRRGAEGGGRAGAVLLTR
jgi:hypothetical protein